MKTTKINNLYRRESNAGKKKETKKKKYPNELLVKKTQN